MKEQNNIFICYNFTSFLLDKDDKNFQMESEIHSTSLWEQTYAHRLLLSHVLHTD